MLNFFLFQAICKAADHVTKTIYIQDKSWVMISSRGHRRICPQGARVYRAVILGISKNFEDPWDYFLIYFFIFCQFSVGGLN